MCFFRRGRGSSSTRWKSSRYRRSNSSWRCVVHIFRQDDTQDLSQSVYIFQENTLFSLMPGNLYSLGTTHSKHLAFAYEPCLYQPSWRWRSGRHGIKHWDNASSYISFPGRQRQIKVDKCRPYPYHIRPSTTLILCLRLVVG